MTIKELKEKIAGFTEALAINEVNPFNKVFAESMKDSLIELQAELLDKLENRPVSNGIQILNKDLPESNRQCLPWDWDNRDSQLNEHLGV